MLRSRFARWTKPLTTSLLLEILADLNGFCLPMASAESGEVLARPGRIITDRPADWRPEPSPRAQPIGGMS